MKIKLKPGINVIANANFELKAGQIVDISASQYDQDTMDIVEADPEPVKIESIKKDELDLNGDGKVDKKDASIAGKVLKHTSKSKSKKKKGGK